MRNVPAILSAILLGFLFPAAGLAQQAGGPSGSSGCPDQPPGVYVHGAGGWHSLSPATPFKTKAAHGFLSSMTDGAVAAQIRAEYRGPHATVQVKGAQPTVCVSHLMTPADPMIVRLHEKKKDRELDGGSIRALPVVGGSKETKAESSIVVPTATEKPEYGIVLVRPQAALAPGEYAVMFGPTNLAIFDFGVEVAK
jgi:hypothetical protein